MDLLNDSVSKVSKTIRILVGLLCIVHFRMGERELNFSIDDLLVSLVCVCRYAVVYHHLCLTKGCTLVFLMRDLWLCQFWPLLWLHI